MNNEKTNTIFICWILDFANYKADCRNTGWEYFWIASHFFVTSVSLLETDSGISCSWKRHSSMRHYQAQLMINCLITGGAKSQQLGCGNGSPHTLSSVTSATGWSKLLLSESISNWHCNFCRGYLTTGGDFPLRHGVLLKNIFRISCSTLACCNFLLR